MRKVLVAAAVAVSAVGAWSGVAGAHFAVVDTPSGQDNCQFMGNSEHPHQGHSHGHMDAQEHEQSDTFDVGGC